MKVNIKKLDENAVIPFYAHPDTDAGMDLTAISKEDDNGVMTYKTGIAMEIPKGYVGLIFPRSSVYKLHHALANSVGVIDSGYRGEIMFKFYKNELEYEVGDRVGQIIIMPYPQIEFNEVKELDDSARGEGGFGSTTKVSK